jgi:uncharacterized protein (TIGR00730 family)
MLRSAPPVSSRVEYGRNMSQLSSICVYCGSSNKVAPHFMEAAFQLGRLIGRAGIELVYGGGRVGLMGRAADGCLVEGGRVTGIIPRHLSEREVGHRGLGELILVDTMHERKFLMEQRSDAFIVLPGGFGTLDEMFEIVTWRQLGLHDKPVVLVDLAGYWTPLHQLMDGIVAEGFASPAVRDFVTVVEDVEAALPALGRLLG